MPGQTDQKVIRARRGCFFYGAVAFLMLMVLAIAGSLIGYRLFKRTVQDYTDPNPAAFPEDEISGPQLQQVQDRVNAFRDAVRSNKPTEPIELGILEINALLAASPDLKALKDKLRVAAIDRGKVQAVVSLPLDQVGLSSFRGRYFNGTATLDISFSNGLLRVIPTDLVVKGKHVPKIYMDVIRRQNLARPLDIDSRASAAMNRLQNVKVENGNLVIVPKASE